MARNINNVITFNYRHSMELNVVQIIFARMNATLILHIISNEQINVVQILMREKMLVWKSGVSDSESYEYRDSFEKYFGSFPSSLTPKLWKLLKSLFIDMFIFRSQFWKIFRRIWKKSINKLNYLCPHKVLHISFLRRRQTNRGSQCSPRSVISVCQRRVKHNLRLFMR